jgi:class 3 adenylate cyclase
LAQTHDVAGHALGVGVGIDSGKMKFGEFGHSHRDLTAIGTVVNTAARAQSAAKAEQILVTKQVHDRAPSLPWADEANEYQLKGFDSPISLYAAS